MNKSIPTTRQKIISPLPTQLELYNLCMKDNENDDPREEKQNKQHHHHRTVGNNISLLPATTLEILLKNEVIKSLQNNNPHTFRPIWNDINDYITSNNAEYTEEDYQEMTIQITTKTRVISTIPIYPNRLRRLSLSVNNLPKELPPNTIILKFDDDVLRMDPLMHDVLVSKNLVSLIPSVDGNALFSDHVFEYLEQEIKVQTGNNLNNNPKTKPSSKDELFSNDLFSLLGEGEANEKKNDAAVSLPQEPCIISQISLPSSLLPPPAPPREESMIAQQYYNMQQQHHKSTLEHILKFELQQCQNDIQYLRNETNELEKLYQSLLIHQQQYKILGKSHIQQQEFAEQSLERLKSQQKFLLRELLLIYPIHEISLAKNDDTEYNTNTRYSIRSIELPQVITYTFYYFTSAYSSAKLSYDDQVSTALGFISHFLTLIYSIFNFSLRFPMKNVGTSRAVILQDSKKSWPLFKTPGVEKDMLEFGLLLLHKNVDVVCLQLLDYVGYHEHILKDDMHILQKLDNVLNIVLAS